MQVGDFEIFSIKKNPLGKRIFSFFSFLFKFDAKSDAGYEDNTPIT
jgi:hypothetical protein